MSDYDHSRRISLGARLLGPFRFLYAFFQGLPLIGVFVRPAFFLLLSITASYFLTTALVELDMCPPEGRETIQNLLVFFSLPTIVVWGFKMTGRNTKNYSSYR